MKKYIVFMLIFVGSYTVLQWGSGLLLTMFYTPEKLLTNQQEASFGESSIMPFVMMLMTATLAYFISQKWFYRTEGNR